MGNTKIVCIGDSLTAGYGLEPNENWPFLLAKELKIEVINSGISGDTTSGMLARFKAMVIDHKPTHTIIMGGTNDLSLNLTDEQILSNILAMTRYARHHNIETIIGIPTPFFPPMFDSSQSAFLSGNTMKITPDRDKIITQFLQPKLSNSFY